MAVTEKINDVITNVTIPSLKLGSLFLVTLVGGSMLSKVLGFGYFTFHAYFPYYAALVFKGTNYLLDKGLAK